MKMNRNACEPCALEERDHPLQASWDAFPFFLSCFDCDGRYLHVNRHYADYWAIDASAIRGRHFQEVLPRRLYEKHAKLFAECLQGKTIEFFEEDGAGGSYGVYAPVCTDGGKIRRVIVIIMASPPLPVLSQSAANATCRAKEFLLSLPGAGMIVNQQGMIVEAFDDNRLLPASAIQRWPGQHLQAVFPAGTAGELIGEIDRAITGGKLQFAAYRIKCGESSRIFHVRIAPLRYLDNGLATAACYWTDATGLTSSRSASGEADYKRQWWDLLNMLVERQAVPSCEIMDQAWQLNLNLSQDFSCYVIASEAGQGEDRQGQADDARLADKLGEEPGVIAWQTKEGVAVLIPAGNDAPPGQQRELDRAACWEGLLSDCFPKNQYSIGIAPFQPETFWKLPKVYEQARIAVDWGKKLRPSQRIHHYLDIGVFQFFPAVRNTEHVQDFVERTLSRLEKYDQLHGTDLMDTLVKILQTNNLQEVARQMYAHRQTVLFRKRRIEEILDISLNDFEARLAIGMALKLRQGFGAKPKPAP